MLNGKPFKETNILGRIFRAGSMVPIEPGASPGQKLLWRSNYDLRTSTWNSPSPDNVSLKDENFLRSEFAKEIGLTKINGENPEQWLNRLSKDPRIIASINEMIADKKSGDINIDPVKGYYHNRVIHNLFYTARVNALTWVGNRRWNILFDKERVIKLPSHDPLGSIERLINLDIEFRFLSSDVLQIDLRNEQFLILQPNLGNQNSRNIQKMLTPDSENIFLIFKCSKLFNKYSKNAHPIRNCQKRYF